LRSSALALAIVVAALLAAGRAAPSYAASDGFVLICNARAAVTRLSHSEVRALYTGKAKTLGGTAAVVVIRPDEDVPFSEFSEQVFGVPTKTLLAKIKQEVFKGEMTRPLKATTDDDVVRHVSGSPGVIGVVSTNASVHLPSTVTVIAIGG